MQRRPPPRVADRLDASYLVSIQPAASNPVSRRAMSGWTICHQTGCPAREPWPG